jgi:alkylhydroperoxidase family enzyme
MDERFRPLRDALARAILDRDGATDRAARRRAYDGEADKSAVGSYVATVRDHAYRVTDDHVTALRAAGMSEPAVFELTVATAVGQATRQYDSALAALAEAVKKHGGTRS